MDTSTLLAKHVSGSSRHYPFLLVFVREWTHGTALAGMTMTDSLPFCTAKDAAEWVTSVNAIHAKSFARKDSRMTYKVVEHAVLDARSAA